MQFNLHKFSDFVWQRILEEDDNPVSPQTTPNPISSHWLDRTAVPGDQEYQKKKSRIVPFEEDINPEGFVLKQNLLNSNGIIIDSLTLNNVLKGSVLDFEELRKILSRIFYVIARNSKIKNFLIQTENISGLKSNWIMFLGKVCLKNSSLTDEKLFLDFRWVKAVEEKTGGSMWGGGKGIDPGAMTILFYSIGSNSDPIYNRYIQKNAALGEIANQAGQRIVRVPTASEIKSVQLLYPLGKNFTFEIDLQENLFQILNSIQTQIDSAQEEFPVVDQKQEKIDFVPQKIFNLFQENAIWFLDGDLVFNNEKILDIFDAIDDGRFLIWDSNQKTYSSPTYIFTDEMLVKTRKRLENFFSHFYEQFEKQKYSRVSLQNLNTQNFKNAFEDIKLCFDNFKFKKGMDFKKLNSKMRQEIEKTTENKKNRVSDFSNFLAEREKISARKKNPCWSGYKKVGMKTKNGRSVPNCVPVNKSKIILGENDNLDDIISGFEDLGINKNPRVWFIDWESNSDGCSRSLWCVEGYTRPEVILKIAETLSVEDGVDQEDWENFLNLVEEDEDGIWGELVQLVQESNYREEEEKLISVNVMYHPKPSSLDLEPRSLTLYNDFNSFTKNAELVQEADKNLKSWYGINLDSIEKLESDHWI